jgi:hypothetical protein
MKKTWWRTELFGCYVGGFETFRHKYIVENDNGECYVVHGPELPASEYYVPSDND